MKNFICVALSAICLGGFAQAKDLGQNVGGAGKAFDRDARQFGASIQGISTRVKGQMASGAVEMVTGPAGETVMVVGDVTGEAAMAVAHEYHATSHGLRCLAGDPLNPFRDIGCVVRYGERTLIIGEMLLKDGSTTLVVGAADGLSDVFNGFAQIMNSAANHTGRMSNPAGAFFVLAYHTTEATKMVVHFALVDVVARSISVLANNGTTIIVAPLNALYDIVTLKWDRAAVKIVNLPVRILNALVNIPTEIVFGKNAKDMTLRVLSPMGRLINKDLGINDSRVEHLETAH